MLKLPHVTHHRGCDIICVVLLIMHALYSGICTTIPHKSCCSQQASTRPCAFGALALLISSLRSHVDGALSPRMSPYHHALNTLRQNKRVEQVSLKIVIAYGHPTYRRSSLCLFEEAFAFF